MPTQRAANRSLPFLLGSAAVMLVAALGCVLFLSNYLNYAAESISLASLLRIAEGKSYVGSLDGLPQYWNPYSPYLAWILTPVIRLLRLATPEQVALTGRLIVVAIFGVYSLLVRRFFRAHHLNEYDGRCHTLALLWVMLLFLSNLTAIRPDLLSFLAEFASFSLLFRYLFSPGSPRFSLVVLAGVAAGVAIAVKLNTVGGVAGLSLFLLAERKGRSAALYVTCIALTAAALLLVNYAIYGPKMMLDWLSILTSTGFTGVGLVRRGLQVVDEIGVGNLLLVALATWGLLTIHLERPREAKLYACFLGGSVLVATVGQSKIGAASNYYIGAFVLATIPLSIGLRRLFDPTCDGAAARSLRFVLYLLWPVLLLKAAVLPVNILLNERPYYHYDEVKSMIARDYPGATIYTPEESAAVHFHTRVLLGPWTEQILTLSDAYSRKLPAIRRALADRGFTLAVVPGSGCESWEPHGLFKAETEPLRRLIHKNGKICVFARR